MQSYNEDIEGYQIPEDPSIQISSDDEGTAAHGSWQDGAAKRGAKRKHAWSAGVGRCAACAAEPWMAGIKLGSRVCRLAPASMPLDISGWHDVSCTAMHTLECTARGRDISMNLQGPRTWSGPAGSCEE